MSDNKDEDKRQSANLAVLVGAAILVILGVVLMHLLSAHLKTERCLEERRRGCDTRDNP